METPTEETLDAESLKTTEETPIVEEPKPAPVDPMVALHIRSLEAKVKEYESKISGVRDYVKNMEAEIEQIRVRSQRDLQKNIDQSISNFFSTILPVVDNFERSLRTVEKEDAFSEGIRIIHQQFEDTLKRVGLTRIHVKGAEFNPLVHEAIATLPVLTEGQDGKILEEAKAGYQFKETVIRPAQVVVGAKPHSELHESQNG